MEDQEIISLYLAHEEAAIVSSELKYGAYCRRIAHQVLGDWEDVRECVADVWLKAWNRIPDDPPRNLKAYFAKLTRELAIDCWRREHSEKRGGGQIVLALEELSECIPARHNVEQAAEQQELARVLRAFLRTLEPVPAKVFLCHYWYMDSVPQIAERFGFSQSKVSSMLHRTRKKLKKHLKEAGYFDEKY